MLPESIRNPLSVLARPLRFVRQAVPLWLAGWRRTPARDRFGHRMWRSPEGEAMSRVEAWWSLSRRISDDIDESDSHATGSRRRGHPR